MVQRLISFKEAQSYLGFKSPASLREYIKKGLPVVTVGKSRKIDIDSLNRFIKDHEKVESKTGGDE